MNWPAGQKMNYHWSCVVVVQSGWSNWMVVGRSENSNCKQDDVLRRNQYSMGGNLVKVVNWANEGKSLLVEVHCVRQCRNAARWMCSNEIVEPASHVPTQCDSIDSVVDGAVRPTQNDNW